MTDIVDSQFGNRCAELIMDLHQCFEANGVIKARKVCKVIQEDIDECNRFKLREKAQREIYNVRAKKMLKGELKSEDAYLEPAPANSFLYFPHHK